MGVYIKGMEMPTERESFNLTIKYNGLVFDTETGIQVAEAYELPPHGRLIDADKIGLTNFEIIMCQKRNPFKNALEILFEKIENAPTIIPAEEGE